MHGQALSAISQQQLQITDLFLQRDTCARDGVVADSFEVEIQCAVKTVQSNDLFEMH